MNLNPNAEIFVPDNSSAQTALERTTHMGIGAHQDDLEILAMHGISACIDSTDDHFSGITCTDGAGSARTGKFADVSDEEMKEVRWEEQREAARIGKYSSVTQLKHPSSVVKDPENDTLADELVELISAASPKVIYTHNLADKHQTHIAVISAVIKALRALPETSMPEMLYGVEIWRGLDWMPDDQKVLLDLSGTENLALSLIGLYESQIAGGKRYDQATIGRWHANATYFESHDTDTATSVAYAMDLTPLIQNRSLSPIDITIRAIDDFRTNVKKQLENSFRSQPD